MVPLKLNAYKTRATKKQKGQQLLNDFILYSLTTLACTSFCSSPFWYPPFCATFNVFFFFSLPDITSLFFASNTLFIVGNLIVIFLLGESKFFTSKSKAYNVVCHDTYECKRIDDLQPISLSQEENGKTTTREVLKQETQVKIFKVETCEQFDEEFFESCNDEENCELDTDRNFESSGYVEEDLSCSKRELVEEKHDGLEGDLEVSLPTEELNKLVDDFIARIIRQRMLEN